MGGGVVELLHGRVNGRAAGRVAGPAPGAADRLRGGNGGGACGFLAGIRHLEGVSQ